MKPERHPRRPSSPPQFKTDLRLLPALVWAVPNEAGTVEVVGKKAGVVAARFQLKTIGQPERIELSPDLKTLKNDGTPVTAGQAKVYQGRVVVVVRSGAQPGKITVRATTPGLTGSEAVLTVQP